MSVTLEGLVFNNEYELIKEGLENAKRESKGSLRFTDIVNNACRDAIKLGHERIVELFLEEGLQASDKAHKKNGTWAPFLYFAAKAGRVALVQLLIDKGAEIKAHPYYEYNNYQSAMCKAIEKGHVDVVQCLLENGAEVEGHFKMYHGKTFLGMAALKGQELMVELFVKHGANIKIALATIHTNFMELYQSYHRAIRNSPNDHEKQALIEKRDALLQKHSEAVRLIFDHAPGTNFSQKETKYFSQVCYGYILDATGSCYAGVSIESQPITPQDLATLGLNPDHAIITRDNIDEMEDKPRSAALKKRLATAEKLQGGTCFPDGIYNLVSLADAAKKGLFEVVQARLNADVNPNQSTTDLKDSELAIVSAAKNGFFDVVKLLAEHPQMEQKARIMAAEEAKAKGHVRINDYLKTFIGMDEKDHTGNAQIHNAVKAMLIKEVQRLINRGANINLPNKAGWTPLSIAASKPINIDILKLLLLKQADPNACTKRSSPLYEAAKAENCEAIDLLLSHGADPNQLIQNSSPLHAAAKAGNTKAFALLLPKTKKNDYLKEVDIVDFIREAEQKNIPWYVPLMFDSSHSIKWLEILKLLKEHGADLNAVEKNKTIFYRFIWNFSSFRRSDDNIRRLPDHLMHEFSEAFLLLDFFLENGADLKTAHNGHQMPLQALIKSLGFIEGVTERAINSLLEHGADINALDFGGTPLHYASKKDPKLVQLLIKAGADVNASIPGVNTPLHFAVDGETRAVQLLVEAGADVNARNQQEHTPLHLAAAGRPEAVELLLKAGADINALDAEGLTPLAYSQKKWAEYYTANSSRSRAVEQNYYLVNRTLEWEQRRKG